MLRLPKQSFVESLFVICLAVACMALFGFQCHWASEVSRATEERLRNGFDGQVQLLGHAFDSLGLSMVREIVQTHGGTILPESTLGQGSTFIVRLPALAEEKS